MSKSWRHVLKELLSPLSLAAYAAWAVVWVVTLGSIAAHAPHWLWPARIALLLFLAGFVSLIASERAQRGWPYFPIVAMMTACALAAVALRPNSTAPILLVLLAAQLAARLELRALVASLLAINLAALALLRGLWQFEWDHTLLTVLAFASFQTFAAMVVRNARRAEDMAADLRATNAELLTTRTLLAESARDAERLRLSRELHDVAGHGLTALKLNLGVLQRDARQPDPERIALCAQLADELLQNLRSVVQQMRAAPGIDLGSALQRLGLPFPRPRLRLQIEDGLQIDDREQIEAVLRAVQEALTNAARHADAEVLQVRLDRDGRDYRLTIDDDGRGRPPARTGGGLSGMRERFQGLGGELRIEAGSLGGLGLRARWPRARPA